MYRPSLRRFTPSVVLTAAALFLLVSPALRAKSGDAGGDAPIDVNFFYDTLKEDGSWYNTTEYGDVWQPYIAYKSDSWRPYTDGYWSYTDGGWMFVSNENFGWAVYHYGRWTRLKDIGWAWVPGTDWAPAWVTWRASKPDGNGPPGPDGAAVVDATTTTAPAPALAPDDKNPPPTEEAAPRRAPAAGGPGPGAREDYIGWAPLPPEPVGYTTEDYAYGPTVDVDFGIDPYDYCFTDVRYFGAPYIAAVIFDPGRSYYYADRSVNITNVYYNRSGPYRGVYAGGPDYNRFRGVTQRPIPQYNLRQTKGMAAQNAIRGGKFNQINGKTLAVPAPQVAKTDIGPDGKVKLTRAGALAKAQVNRGAPAAAGDNPAYKQARESFAKQGQDYRAQHPEAVNRATALKAAGDGAATPETAPKITTTDRAREEERAARQTAGEKAPPTEPRQEALKDHPEGTPERHDSAPREAKTESAPAPAEGKHHSHHESSRHDAARDTEGRAPEGSSRERHSNPVSRERESAERSHAAAPRAEAHGAPRPAPEAKSEPKQEGGGEKKDKKK